MLMITHYGYTDGSGEYYIVIDSDKCNGCGKCVQKCPQKALELEYRIYRLRRQNRGSSN